MTSHIELLLADQKRRDAMNPLDKGCCLDDLTLITIMAHNALELMAFAIFMVSPSALRDWERQLPFGVISVMRAMKAFGNYRLAAIEDGLTTCVDPFDNYDWISGKVVPYE